MAKSGPEPPPPAQQPVAEPAGEKNTFDGDESTEVMDVPLVPAKAIAALPPEAPQDVEEKDRTYIAPRVIPAAAVPDKADGAKIVLNIPDARADRAPPAPPQKQRPDLGSNVVGDKPAVAEVRARRRAPTVKMVRPNLAALQPTDGIDVSMDDDLEPPPPLDAPAHDADSLAGSAPMSASKGLVQAVPIGLAPLPAPEGRPSASLPVPRQRVSGPAHEAPATAIAIHETSREKSRLPWVLFGALTLGAAAAGVFVATRRPEAGFATKAPAAQQTAAQQTAAQPTASPTLATPATATVAANPTAEPTPSVAELGSATAPSAATAQPTLAVSPPPRPTYPRPTATTPAYTAPRPTATFPRPPTKKTSDIPSGI